MKYIGYIILALFLLSACAGEDESYKDTVPPTQPVLIPHLGDAGDGTIEIDGFQVELTDDNNGIDTVPEGHMMRLMWEPLIDNDLSHIKIYRFSDIEADSVVIDEIQANQNSYLDEEDLVERIWYSYYIELFDSSGNSTISDTVSYALLAKPYLLSPNDGDFVDITDLNFVWNSADDRSGFYRVLVWNEENKLIWNGDLDLAMEDDPLTLPFPILVDEENPIESGDVLRWRVDYFDWDEQHQMYMGSESPERIFYVQ